MRVPARASSGRSLRPSLQAASFVPSAYVAVPGSGYVEEHSLYFPLIVEKKNEMKITQSCLTL